MFPLQFLEMLLCRYHEIAEGDKQRARREHMLRLVPRTRIELAHDFFLPGNPGFSLPDMPALHFD